MKTRYWDVRLWIILILVVAYASSAVAGGTDIDVTQSNDMNSQTTGDLAIEGTNFESKAFGFSHSLGDVDINDCLASTQWGSIVVSKQKVVLNAWCAAEVYDAKGMYEMAAIMRCNVPEILAEFDSEADCERANRYSPPTVYVEPEPEVSYEELYRQEQMHDEQLESLLDRVEQLEQKPEPRPRPPQTVVQQTEFLDAEKKEKLRALRDNDEDEDK